MGPANVKPFTEQHNNETRYRLRLLRSAIAKASMHPIYTKHEDTSARQFALKAMIASHFKTGNCGEHAAVSFYNAITDPRINRNESVSFMSSTNDHAWVELTKQRPEGDIRIAIDAWADGPAIRVRDDRFYHDNGKVSERAAVTGSDVESIKQMKSIHQKAGPLISHQYSPKKMGTSVELLRKSVRLSDRDVYPDQDHVIDPGLLARQRLFGGKEAALRTERYEQKIDNNTLTPEDLTQRSHAQARINRDIEAIGMWRIRHPNGTRQHTVKASTNMVNEVERLHTLTKNSPDNF